MGQWHLEHAVQLLFGQGDGLLGGLHQPVGVAGEGPAGDAAHQRPRVPQLGQQHAQHVRQVGQQALGTALADGPQCQDRALPSPPILLLHRFASAVNSVLAATSFATSAIPQDAN